MNIKDIYAAKDRLKDYLTTTPLLYSSLLKRELNKHIWLKLETQQPTGSFKPRPAFNSILVHLELARKKGVIASSSGNFAQGVAFAARELNVSAMIIMTKNASPYKVERTRNLGAEVVLCGNSHEERIATTLELQKKTDRVLLQPYDSFETIAGDGTISLELSEQLGETLDKEMTVLVPVSGGGLIAGISFALKALHPTCKIIGVQPQSNGSLAQSLQSKKCINVGAVDSVADALTASSLGEKAFAIIQNKVDDVLCVTEDEIQSATRFLIEEHKLVVEPGGSVTIAALLAGKVTANYCVCILSGGNIHLWKE